MKKSARTDIQHNCLYHTALLFKKLHVDTGSIKLLRY